jgi:glutathione peroxidase
LYQDNKDQGLVVLGFPSAQFAAKEQEMKRNLLNYEVTFQIMEEIEMNGDNQHPVRTFLKSEKPVNINWNFEKVWRVFFLDLFFNKVFVSFSSW